MTFERQKTNKRVISDLKKRSAFGLVFYILLSVVVVFADNFYDRHAVLTLVFIGALVGVCLFRLAHLILSPRIPERYTTLSSGIFFGSVVLSALIWGVALALVMLQPNEYSTQLIMTVCVAGLAAGGVVAFVPHLRLAVTYDLAMLMPVIVIMLVTGSSLSLALMIFSFAVYMVLVATRGNEEYWDALENEDLLKIKSRELARLSNTDVLTGLFNRRYFDKALEKEWKRSGRNNSAIGVILLDIDYFKRINDTFGHPAGDAYLKELAGKLTSVFKRDTDIVARYGGEEFIVLLPDADADRALQMAREAILRVGAMNIDYQGSRIGATISAGVSVGVPDFNLRPDSIIASADKALYLAKKQGRNRAVYYEPRIHEAVV
ncbi:MAG: GGDEF domain-containing protein [Deltaproteobacteria bacterium]|nr:GGDEF domain-containing protein [Deltaproteobacteria bacterium]